MIVFDGVWKFNGSARRPPLLADVSAQFPRHNVAILCKGEHVELLTRLFIGTDLPDRGRITRSARISWPISELAGMRGNLSVAENIRFVARVNRVDEDLLTEYVDEFVKLGRALRDPLSKLDRSQRTVLSYAVALAIPFDSYVINSPLKTRSAGRAMQMVEQALVNRLSHSNAIIISDDVETALRYGRVGVVFRNARFEACDSVEHAAESFLGGARGDR